MLLRRACTASATWRSNTGAPSQDAPTQRLHLPGVPSIQMNVPAIYHNALPPNITHSSSPGTQSTSTLYDCWQTHNFPFFRPTNGTITCTLPLWAASWPPTSKSKNPPLLHDGPLKWPHRRVAVLNPNWRDHTKAWENFARRANVLSQPAHQGLEKHSCKHKTCLPQFWCYGCQCIPDASGSFLFFPGGLLMVAIITGRVPGDAQSLHRACTVARAPSQ